MARQGVLGRCISPIEIEPLEKSTMKQVPARRLHTKWRYLFVRGTGKQQQQQQRHRGEEVVEEEEEQHKGRRGTSIQGLDVDDLCEQSCLGGKGELGECVVGGRGGRILGEWEAGARGAGDIMEARDKNDGGGGGGELGKIEGYDHDHGGAIETAVGEGGSEMGSEDTGGGDEGVDNLDNAISSEHREVLSTEEGGRGHDRTTELKTSASSGDQVPDEKLQDNNNNNNNNNNNSLQRRVDDEVAHITTEIEALCSRMEDTSTTTSTTTTLDIWGDFSNRAGRFAAAEALEEVSDEDRDAREYWMKLHLRLADRTERRQAGLALGPRRVGTRELVRRPSRMWCTKCGRDSMKTMRANMMIYNSLE